MVEESEQVTQSRHLLGISALGILSRGVLTETVRRKLKNPRAARSRDCSAEAVGKQEL